MNKRQQFLIVLAAAPGVSNDAAVRSLRALLKASLRQFGLRCVSAERTSQPSVREDGSGSTIEGKGDERVTRPANRVRLEIESLP